MGGFDTDTTGWSAGASASLSSVAGGQSGNCLLVARNGANNPSANEVKTTILNGLYKAIAYAKQKEEATVSVGFKKMGLAQMTVILLGEAPADWTTGQPHNIYGTTVGTSTYFFVQVLSTNATDGAYFDTLSLQQVLTPSSSGIYFTDPVVTGTFNYNATSFTAIITKE